MTLIIKGTTTEADPKGAASFLKKMRDKSESEFNPRNYHSDWFSRSQSEVREKLGRDSLWDNPSPVGVGLDYERLAGVNIGGNHPVIDDVRAYDGIVTSMKVINTRAKSYLVGDSIFNVGKGYVDKFDNFTGVNTSDGFVLPRDQIQGFHLEIAVRTDMTSSQRGALERLQDYGEQKGVRVIIAEVE